jgi:hypothetical protein
MLTAVRLLSACVASPFHGGENCSVVTPDILGEKSGLTTIHFSNFLGHHLADSALVCAEGSGIAVEQPPQVTLEHGTRCLALTQRLKRQT